MLGLYTLSHRKSGYNPIVVNLYVTVRIRQTPKTTRPPESQNSGSGISGYW
jgi:hypothetical protein